MLDLSVWQFFVRQCFILARVPLFLEVKLVGAKREVSEVEFSLPRRKAEIIDLNESPPKSRPTTSGSTTTQKSKTPKPSTGSLNLQAELENIFPDFAASVQKVIMKHKGTSAAYNVSQRIIKLHDELIKN